MNIAHKTKKPIPIIEKKEESGFDIMIHNGGIAIQFKQPIRTAVFTPDQAIQFAQNLVSLVHEIQKQKEDAVK